MDEPTLPAHRELKPGCGKSCQPDRISSQPGRKRRQAIRKKRDNDRLPAQENL